MQACTIENGHSSECMNDKIEQLTVSENVEHVSDLADLSLHFQLASCGTHLDK